MEKNLVYNPFMLFDTHVHYNLSPFYDDWQEHWAKAQEHGVTKSIIVAAGMTSSQKAVELAEAAEGLYAAIGKHPDVYRKAVKIKLQAGEDWQTVFGDIEEDIKKFRELIENNSPKGGSLLGRKKIVVAVGEIGLDYFRMPEKGSKRDWMIEAQKKAFEAQINLALEFNLPIIVHVRDKVGKTDAHVDTLEILRSASRRIKFVLHCISGPKEYVQKAIELGGYVGVGGNVTYDDKLIDLIKIVPEDKLLLETDAPYLAPEPHKREVCEPWMVKLVAEYLEEKLGIKSRQLYDNACSFFNL